MARRTPSSCALFVLLSSPNPLRLPFSGNCCQSIAFKKFASNDCFKDNSLMSLIFNPPIIAHRGASAYAPENTFAAFQKAKELGMYWVEFDVQLTRDGEIVIFHDDTLNRTTNGHGKLLRHTDASLRSLDAGSWFHSNFSEERIPRFSDVLDYLRKTQLSANVELKPHSGFEEWLVMKILEKMTQIPNLIPHLLFSSFSVVALEYMRQHHGLLQLGMLMDAWSLKRVEVAKHLKCVSIHLNHKIVTQERIKDLKSRGFRVLCYTVNDQKRASTLFSWGVDAVFSDCPDQILGSVNLRRET